MSSQVDNIYTLPSRVLLATDLIDLRQTLPVAIDYGLNCRAELKLIHVLPYLNIAGTNPSRPIHGDEHGVKHYTETVLEDAAIQARAAGVKCSWIVRTGQVADRIQQLVQEWSPDRVIIGSHSSEKRQPSLLGSVAESIFRDLDVPVFAIGPDVRHDGKLFSKKARILFATALDRESRLVAESILKFAKARQAELTMLHVVPDIVKDHPSAVRVRAYAGRMFQEILSGTGAEGLHPSCMIERGQVGDTILRVAGEGHFDLILLGAVSGSSFRRDIMPGTAYQVIAMAPCPVLVLKGALRPEIMSVAS